MWFADPGFNLPTGRGIGRITPSGQITEFPVPEEGRPSSITHGPDGNLWFTAFGQRMIGRITPSGQITEFQLPPEYGHPEDIGTGPDGYLWFTEGQHGEIGRITPHGQIFQVNLTTQKASQPTSQRTPMALSGLAP